MDDGACRDRKYAECRLEVYRMVLHFAGFVGSFDNGTVDEDTILRPFCYQSGIDIEIVECWTSKRDKVMRKVLFGR
jgi:hypothetical protein